MDVGHKWCSRLKFFNLLRSTITYMTLKSNSHIPYKVLKEGREKNLGMPLNIFGSLATVGVYVKEGI